MKVKCEEYIRLTEEVCWKLDVIASSFEEVVSKKMIIEAALDQYFSLALQILYREGEISDEGLQTGLDHMDQLLADKTRELIAAEMDK